VHPGYTSAPLAVHYIELLLLQVHPKKGEKKTLFFFFFGWSLQQSQEAAGGAEGSAGPSSIQEGVMGLVEVAMKPENLAMMDPTWMPWFEQKPPKGGTAPSPGTGGAYIWAHTAVARQNALVL